MIENPTNEQLRTLKGIVYMILNKINGMAYIGESINPFNIRYSAGKWWKWSDNDYLKNSASKYGKENFQIKILESDIQTKEKLKELEVFYIWKFNTINPNGFNLVEYLGDYYLLPNEIKERMLRKSVYIYKILNTETNEIIETDSPMNFCLKYNMNPHSFKGFMIFGYVFNFKLLSRELKPQKPKLRNLPIILKNVKTKEIVTFQNRKEFIEKYNANDPDLLKLFKGLIKTCKGWCLPETTDEMLIRKKKCGTVEYLLINPKNETIKIKDLPNFCRNNGLDYESLFKVISKIRASYRGWTIPDNNIQRKMVYKRIVIFDIKNNLEFTFKNVKEATDSLPITTGMFYWMKRKNREHNGYKIKEIEYLY